jgi:hypothetical protein
MPFPPGEREWINTKEMMMEGETKKKKLGDGVLNPGARPMMVYVDDNGVMYLCDRDVDLSKPLKDQACWTCDMVQFTRGG